MRNPFKSSKPRPQGTKHASDVPRADIARAEGACLVQRAVKAVQEDVIDSPNALCVKLMVAKEHGPGYKEKTRWVLPFRWFRTSLNDIAALGIGVELYFWQASTLATMFFIMGCCSVPSIQANIKAAGYQVLGDDFVTNLLVMSTLGMRSEAFDIFPPACIELLCTLLFSGYLVWLRWWNSIKAANNNKRFITSADYTVEVTNLPPAVRAEDLKRFFEGAKLIGRDKRAKVHSVELVLAERAEMVALVQARRKTLRDIDEMLVRVGDGDADEEALAPLRDKAQAQYAKLRNKLGVERGTSCGLAYVTFEDAEDAQAAAKTLSLGLLERLVMCVRCQEPPPTVHGARPDVSRAAEVSDVKWENLSYQGECCGYGPACRAWATNLVAMAAIVPVFWLLLVLTRYKLGMSRDLAQQSLAEAGALPAVMPPSAPMGSGPWWEPERLQDVIQHALDALLDVMSLGGALGITAVSAIVSVTISLLSISLRHGLAFLTYYERPASVTYLQMRLLTTASAVYILNYVVLMIFVYTPALQESFTANEARLEALLASVAATGSAATRSSDELQQLYERVELQLVDALGGGGDYYSQAGLLPQMIVLALTDAVFLQINVLIEAVLYPLVYRFVGNRCASQPMMDYWYEPPNMSLALSYAYMLKTAAICLVFAPAAPVLYFIASAGLVAMLAAQKLALVKVFGRPPLLDDEIAERSREVLGVLLLAHVLTSALFYAKQALDSGSDLSLAQTSPLAFGLLAWLIYAVVPFQSLLKRNVDEEQTGTNGMRYTAACASGRMEEYRCPSSEHDVRTRDQTLDRMALRTFQLQQKLTGHVTPWLFFERVSDMQKEQAKSCCGCCKPAGDALL